MILVPDSQGQLSLEDYEALESDLEHSKAITSAKDDELQAKDAKLKQLEQHVETLQREITNNATRIQSLVNEKTDVTNKLINSQAAEIQTLSLLREREIELAKSSKVAQEATAVVQSKEALLANLAMENAEATKKLLQDYTKTLDGKENLLSDLATKNAEAIAKLQHDHATALTELEQEHQQALRALRARGDEDTEALEQLQHEYARVRGINTNWTNSTLVLLYRVLGDLKLSTDWPSESEDTDVWFKNRLEEYLQGRIIEAEAHNRVWRYAEERLARIDELQQQNKELKQLLELANKLMTTYKKALD
jgi:DNA repair exonuclease SbcCD ATPase subunit